MNWRTVKAFAAAGITPVLVSCVAAIAWNVLTSREIGAMARFALPVTIVVTVPMAIAATLLLAMPAHYIARRLKRSSCRFYVLGGLALFLGCAVGNAPVEIRGVGLEVGDLAGLGQRRHGGEIALDGRDRSVLQGAIELGRGGGETGALEQVAGSGLVPLGGGKRLPRFGGTEGFCRLAH